MRRMNDPSNADGIDKFESNSTSTWWQCCYQELKIASSGAKTRVVQMLDTTTPIVATRDCGSLRLPNTG